MSPPTFSGGCADTHHHLSITWKYYPSLIWHLKELSDTKRNKYDIQHAPSLFARHLKVLSVTYPTPEKLSLTPPSCFRHPKRIISHLSNSRKKTRKTFAYPFGKKLPIITRYRSFYWTRKILCTWANARIFLGSGLTKCDCVKDTT